MAQEKSQELDTDELEGQDAEALVDESVGDLQAHGSEGLDDSSVEARPAHPNPVIRFLLSAKQLLVDFIEANFKSSESETPKPVSGSKIDSSPRALREDFERRSRRSVGHITGNSVSSTRGNPTRQKKVKVTAKTYKPELDRF